MSIILLVVTDGRRECITRTIPSAQANLKGQISYQLIFDDSGDMAYRDWLVAMFPEFDVIHPMARQGFGGAIRSAWSHLAGRSEPWVFHLEDDFTFNRPVDLTGMAAVLDERPYLAQMALRRQPWNDQEKTAGGVVEQHPGDYDDCTDGAHDWLEHRRFFTTNPSLYRRSLCRGGWPTAEHSEGVFTHQLLEDPTVRFGYWGARDSGEWVTHIGDQRNGNGY